MNNFNISYSNYQVILPLSTEVLIPADSSVRLLVSVLERLDFSKEAVEYTKRKRDVPFAVMLRVVVYGFMRDVRSTRKIEAACRENINFMWLLEGYTAPDHNAVARFIAAVDMNSVLVKVNKLLLELDELKFENAFIDGTKIEANANRYTFVWKKSTEKYRAKLLPKIEAFLKEFNDRRGLKILSLDGAINYLEALDFLKIAGKGKRKTEEQRDLETAQDYLTRLTKYDGYLEKIGENRKSLSKTDPDATFMRLKDDHMMNGQLKPAYNVQLCIESEYITGIYVSSDRNDANTLVPFMDKLYVEYEKRHGNVTLDAGYESEENYAYLKDKNQIAYIKPQNYEKSKTKEYKRQIGRKENMPYDKEQDFYICANGKRLNKAYDTKRKSESGYEAKVSVYQCEDCSGCPKRTLCTKAQEGNNKQIQCSRLFESYRAESLENITSNLGVQLRMNRSIQAEGAFGVMKYDRDFHRFLRRGKENIQKELALVGIAHNLNKLHSNIINDRLGFSLHKPESG
jgi:transposase